MLQQRYRTRPDLRYGMVGHRLLCLSNYNWSPGLGSGHDSIQQAVSLKEGCTELEQDLIDALAQRHSAEARDAADPTVLNMGNSPELNAAFRRSNGASVPKVQRELGCRCSLR